MFRVHKDTVATLRTREIILVTHHKSVVMLGFGTWEAHQNPNVHSYSIRPAPAHEPFQVFFPGRYGTALSLANCDVFKVTLGLRCLGHGA